MTENATRFVFDATIQGELRQQIQGNWTPRDQSMEIFYPDSSLGSISQALVG